MANNFSSIGLRAAGREELSALVQATLASATDVASTADSRHLRWTDSAGSSIYYHLDAADRLACLTPFFAPVTGPAAWRVRSVAASVDPDCRHCSGADCDVLDGDGELVTRAAVQFALFAPYESWLSSERTYDLAVVAFARRVSLYATSADFAAAQASLWGERGAPEETLPLYAEKSFIPEGLFGTGPKPMGERAVALFAGHIESVARLQAADGLAFYHLRVASLPGLVDVVADPTLLERAPVEGDIAWVRAWLVGRPVVPPVVRSG